MLDRIEDELRQEAAKLLAAADVVHEVRTGRVMTTRIETAKRRRRKLAVVPEPGREGLTLALGTATGLEESDLRESELVHTTAQGRSRIA